MVDLSVASFGVEPSNKVLDRLKESLFGSFIGAFALKPHSIQTQKGISSSPLFLAPLNGNRYYYYCIVLNGNTTWWAIPFVLWSTGVVCTAKRLLTDGLGCIEWRGTLSLAGPPPVQNTYVCSSYCIHLGNVLIDRQLYIPWRSVWFGGWGPTSLVECFSEGARVVAFYCPDGWIMLILILL